MYILILYIQNIFPILFQYIISIQISEMFYISFLFFWYQVLKIHCVFYPCDPPQVLSNHSKHTIEHKRAALEPRYSK